MIDLYLDITDLEDLKVERNTYIETEFKKMAIDHLRAGNRVIVKRSWINAPEEKVAYFTNVSDFEDFWTHLYG